VNLCGVWQSILRDGAVIGEHDGPLLADAFPARAMSRTLRIVLSDERAGGETSRVVAATASSGGEAMTRKILRFAVLMVSVVILTARVASAAQVLSSRSLACVGTGPQNGSIAVTERGGVLTLRFRGADLVPGQAITCGHTCGMVFTNGPEVSCGTVGANGRFAARIELPRGICFGFIPFFTTPTTGKCVPSTAP
jgi:hypothetical protein